MTEKELQKLKRADLLELLLMQSQQMDELKKKYDALKEENEQRQLSLTESGSIAEASLRLNGVFDVAQAAADQYLENIRQLEVQANEMLENTRRRCVAMEDETQERCTAKESSVRAECEALQKSTEEKCIAMQQEAELHCESMRTATMEECDAMQEQTQEKCIAMMQKITTNAQEVMQDHTQDAIMQLEQHNKAHKKSKK